MVKLSVIKSPPINLDFKSLQICKVNAPIEVRERKSAISTLTIHKSKIEYSLLRREVQLTIYQMLLLWILQFPISGPLAATLDAVIDNISRATICIIIFIQKYTYVIHFYHPTKESLYVVGNVSE